MTRLRYSAKGFIRSLQISRTNLFAFVEGQSDLYFYDRICGLASRGASLVYDVRMAQELPGNTGGKEALLDFFSSLRRRKLLSHEFKGKKLAIIFFLDKDIDDLLKIRRRSKHLIYTEFYELENYLISQTDACEVAAAAASLDVNSIKSIVGNQVTWMARAAAEWKEWVKLCTLARRLDADCGCTFSSHSRINEGPYGGVAIPRHQDFTARLQTASGLPQEQFQRILDQTGRRIDRIYAAGRHDGVFKGSWYPRFLAEDVRKAARGRPCDFNSLEKRIHAAAAAKLDFEQPWADYFRSRMSAIVHDLQA